jgi:hypothetical protein
VSEGRSFYGSPRTGGRNERRVTAFVVLLFVACVGIAIAKPWDSSVEPAPSVAPSQAPVTPPSVSLPTTVAVMPSTAPSVTVGPLPVAFTTPPPPASGTWTGLRWQRLAPDDPLSLVTSVLRWRRGFVAVGLVARLPATPVWTSADGTHWDPLLFGTSTTFWPGLDILGVADLQTDLVALTETVQYCGEPCSLTYILPVLSWTSPDGRRWTAHLLSPEWPVTTRGRSPLVAFGPVGVLVASRGPAAHLATSTDGSHWHLVPASGFPSRFALTDLQGTATGYVAVGGWMTADGRSEAASLWSSDGQHWSASPTLLPTPPTVGANGGSAVVSLVIGQDGIVAVGRGVTGATIWWQSPDGQRWAALPTFPPLGPTACTGDGCGSGPNGVLVGDGHRMVALRGGAEGGVWTSSDGLTWQRLPASSDIPSEDAMNAVLMPSGVLFSDRTTTWFGEAQGH